eukprot:CAMPEP_0113880606 /NCGR_PEP_ID=MMETSP0780_2-20120614/7884_1 /TAXON_ID=652834 /ORGANISM="Palpitomonas bilix" /LENGTH=151 /DNA_ID=CAMNT_0000867311 /DNA_START=96 /DNA_END=551 /DNA_ORIENTATION=- /assembly_acc=CAM_ASM_000599
MDDNIRNAIRQSAESLLQHAHGNFVTRAARERLLHHIEITTVCTAVEKGYPEKEVTLSAAEIIGRFRQSLDEIDTDESRLLLQRCVTERVKRLTYAQCQKLSHFFILRRSRRAQIRSFTVTLIPFREVDDNALSEAEQNFTSFVLNNILVA